MVLQGLTYLSDQIYYYRIIRVRTVAEYTIGPAAKLAEALENFYSERGAVFMLFRKLFFIKSQVVSFQDPVKPRLQFLRGLDE